MNVYLVGNPLVDEDNGPLRIAPYLQRAYPDVAFLPADPNENFIPEEDSVIIDTVAGISSPQWYADLDAFASARGVTAHDYDLALHLKLLTKVRKISRVTILGIPQDPLPQEVVHALETRMLPAK